MDAWEDSFQCQEFFAMVFDLQSNFSLGLREKTKRKTITCFNEKVSGTKADCGKNHPGKRVLFQKINLKNKNQNKRKSPSFSYTQTPTL